MSTSHTLSTLENDDKFTTLILDHEYCPMDFDKLRFMLDEVKISWDTNSTALKGRTLEDVAVYLLSSVEPFDVTYDESSPMNQIDGFIEVLAHKGYSPFFASIGQYFLAECKNVNDPVDIGQVEKVGEILDLHKYNLAVVFSRRNITGAGKFDAAQAYIVILRTHGKRILSITYPDLTAMVTSRTNFLTFLRNKDKELSLLKLDGNTLASEIQKYYKLYQDGAITKDEYNEIKMNLKEKYLC